MKRMRRFLKRAFGCGYSRLQHLHCIRFRRDEFFETASKSDESLKHCSMPRIRGFMVFRSSERALNLLMESVDAFPCRRVQRLIKRQCKQFIEQQKAAIDAEESTVK